MTMSFVGADGSGFGVIVASSSPAVAARCAHIRGGVGAVATQNVTDPRLGPLLLDQLALGVRPDDAIVSIVRATDQIEYRQLTALSGLGSGYFTGAKGLGTTHAVQGDLVVGAGNMLASRDVVDSAVRAFERAAGDLELRLMAALNAAIASGGEEGPLHSAGLVVTRQGRAWNETDLRIDWADDDPVGELQALLERWMREREDYVVRALDPARAPRYGVPGDR